MEAHLKMCIVDLPNTDNWEHVTVFFTRIGPIAI
jgi:hypothetical protein